MCRSRSSRSRALLFALVILGFAFGAKHIGHAAGILDHHHDHHPDHHAHAAFEHDIEHEVEAAREEGDEAFGTSARGNATVFLDESFRVREGDLLMVSLASEDLVVQTGAGDQAHVVVEGRGRDAAEEFERRRFSADYESGTLSVETNAQQRNGWSNRRASFTVTVTLPERFDARINLASGDVRLHPLSGTLDLNLASGDVHLDEVHGPGVSVNTASGDIVAGQIDADRVSFSTASGDIEIRGVDAGSFDVSAASGDISVEALAAPTSASTGSGDIEFVVATMAEMNLTTGSGDVDLDVPSGAGATLTIESSDIDIDRSLGFEGSRGRRSAIGTIGGGGPDLQIETGSGSVDIH